MTSITTRRRSIARQWQSVGFSTVPAVLTVAAPKCPLCWAALMSAIAVGPAINFQWLRPVAVTLLLASVVASFFQSRTRDAYAPFYVTVVAAFSMYLFKFTLGYNPGVYLAAATLFVASVWNAWPKHSSKRDCPCPEPKI